MRSAYAEYCNMHYFRVRRTGSAGSAESQHRSECSVPGCKAKHFGKGYCLNHYRQHRKGNVPGHDTRTDKVGDRNQAWKGSLVGYGSAHQRVYRARGPAKNFTCACGSPARHWSYDHADPNEITGQVRGRTVKYSGDPAHYVARCVSCHKNFDLDQGES